MIVTKAAHLYRKDSQDLVTPGNAKSQLCGLAFRIMWRRPTLPGVTPVPSALQGLTSLFGMGRGGTPALGRLNRKTSVVSSKIALSVD
jgi:hypothetical protein